MERRGSGFRKILEDYEFQVKYDKSKMPTFDTDDNTFRLTLYNLNYSVTQDVTQDVTQGKILSMIANNNRITTEEIAEKLGVTSRTVKRKIKTMKNVKYIGSGYSGHWEINDGDNI